MMKARPVLDSETNIDGVAIVEAYQVTDQCVEPAVRDEPAFSQSKTDPRVAKTRADCTFVVEKKEQRKATVEHFVSRVFDIARPFQSFITSGFAIENRPTDPQTSERMASYLRARRSKGESFLLAISDLHLLLFLSNLLDMSTDMPILCSKVHHRATPTTARSMRCVAHAQSSATELIFATSDSAPACECPPPPPCQVVARDTADLDGFQMMARPRTSNGGQTCRKAHRTSHVTPPFLRCQIYCYAGME